MDSFHRRNIIKINFADNYLEKNQLSYFFEKPSNVTTNRIEAWIKLTLRNRILKAVREKWQSLQIHKI